MKTLKELEREQDIALIKFWEAVELVRTCEQDLNVTPQALALREAQYQKDQAQEIMAIARMAFLKARIAN